MARFSVASVSDTISKNDFIGLLEGLSPNDDLINTSEFSITNATINLGVVPTTKLGGLPSHSIDNTSAVDSDSVLVYDANATEWKHMTLANLHNEIDQFTAGDGLGKSGNEFSLDIASNSGLALFGANAGSKEIGLSLSTLTAGTELQGGDTFAFVDTSEADTPTKKVTLTTLASKLAGTNIDNASGVLSVDLSSYALTSALTTGLAGKADTTTSIDPDSNSGLSGGGTLAADITFKLDLNSLSTGTIESNDTFAFADTNDNNDTKKLTINSLATFLAGTGLSASNGSISADATDLSSLSDTDIGTITDGSLLFYDGSSNDASERKWKDTSDIKLNDSNGHVAIGASLSNSYRLRVGGSTLIEGDGTTSTELQVEDDTASATFRLYGQTYALEDLTTKYGNAQIQLSTLNAVDISSIGVSGSTATVTTSAYHYFYTNDNITLAGVTTSSGSNINGTHAITRTGDTTFTLDNFDATGGSYSGGTAECQEGNVSILKNDGTYTYLQIGDRPTRTGSISNTFTPIQFRHTSGDVYINNGGKDSDLRVESVNNSAILHTDAARNCVGIGRSGSRPIFFGHTRNASFNIDAQYSVSSEVCTVTPANPVSHLQVFDSVRITASNGTLTEPNSGSKDYTVTSVTMSGDNVSAFTFNTPGKGNTTNSDMVFGIQRHSADYTFGRNRPSAYIRNSGGINNSQTGTLTVNQTATFPDKGCLKIGNEQLVYNSKTSTTFNITERGALWTTAEAHAYDAYITVTDLSYERDYGWGHLGKGLNFAGGMNLSFQAKINDHQSLNEDVFQALTISKTRLRSSISSTDTTIPVDSVADFPSTSGTIRIEQETISYTSVTTTSGSESFNGCTRGTSSTTAVAHINNCLVTNSTSTSCGIIEAPSQAHLAIALRGNDEGDGFHIVAPKGGVAAGDWITQEDDEGSSANWEYTPYNLFKVTSKYIVINEHGQNIDFRVEGQTGDLFKTDAGTDDVLMPLLVAQNYADNSAAATGGIPVGGLYHTNGIVKIRTS